MLITKRLLENFQKYLETIQYTSEEAIIKNETQWKLENILIWMEAKFLL